MVTCYSIHVGHIYLRWNEEVLLATQPRRLVRTRNLLLGTHHDTAIKEVDEEACDVRIQNQHKLFLSPSVVQILLLILVHQLLKQSQRTYQARVNRWHCIYPLSSLCLDFRARPHRTLGRVTMSTLRHFGSIDNAMGLNIPLTSCLSAFCLSVQNSKDRARH